MKRFALSLFAGVALLFLTGAENVKTVNGVAIANVKTVNGVAIANVSTVVGVDNTAGGGGGQSFTDTFTYSNSDDVASVSSSAWSELSGNAWIISNELAMYGGSYVENTTMHTSATDTADQYVKVDIPVFTAGSYAEIAFRITDASSPMYAVYLWLTEDQATFNRKATASDGSYETVETDASVTVAQGQTWGFTCSGSGSSVVIRGWTNPTGDAPTSATNWGGDTTPELVFTDDPTTPVNSGTHVGLGGEMNSGDAIRFDNFFGGDIP